MNKQHTQRIAVVLSTVYVMLHKFNIPQDQSDIIVSLLIAGIYGATIQPGHIEFRNEADKWYVANQEDINKQVSELIRTIMQ